jgi:hypothetical protein
MTPAQLLAIRKASGITMTEEQGEAALAAFMAAPKEPKQPKKKASDIVKRRLRTFTSAQLRQMLRITDRPAQEQQWLREVLAERKAAA